MHIVFRFDADAQTGYGHLMRSSALARTLMGRGHQVTLISRPLSCQLMFQLQGVQCFSFEKELGDLELLITIGKSNKIDWVVIDHYGLDFRWESLVRIHTKRILVIDDLANRNHDCDVLLDQNMATSIQYKYGLLVPAHCRQWLGLDFLLARPEFYESLLTKRNGLLVFLGGGDNSVQLAALLNQLVSLETETLKLLLTSAYGGFSLTKEYSVNIELHLNLNDTAPLCKGVNGAIVRCGFMAYELALVGTPMVIIYATPIQMEVAFSLQNEGYGIALAESALHDPTSLALALESMKQLCPIPMNQTRLFGAANVSNLMEHFQ